MRAPISIILPTLQAETALPDCLSSLSEGLGAGLVRELIVSDGGSTDATLRIADDVGAVILRGAASRGGQLRRGVAASKGTWLLVLHADTILPTGWTGAVQQALATPGAHAFRLGFDQTGLAPTLVAGWANLRTKAFGLPYGDQGLLIDRDTYTAAGGYADIPLMEDVALARALRGQVRLMDARVATSADKYRRQGWVRRGARNLTTLGRYLSGADPERLAQQYRR